MMDNDRGRGLFWNELVCGGEDHIKFCLHGRQEFKYLFVIFQFRNGRVAPGIALALVFGNAQLAADVLVQIICSCLRSLDGESVREVGFGVIVVSL